MKNEIHELQELTSSVNVNGQLKLLIDQYFTQYPNMSINGLAKKSGVGATTLRRIMDQSTKHEPAPHTLLHLISTLYKEKRVPNLLKLIEGPIEKVLSRAFGGYIYSIDSSLSREFESANPELATLVLVC